MPSVEKATASMSPSQRPFVGPASADADENAGKRLQAHGEKLLARYAEVQAFFKEKAVDPTKVTSFKTFVDEYVAALAARYVTTGRFEAPADVATEAVPTPSLEGFADSPAMRLAIASGFNPDAD